jgi:glycine cleavage system aminomethyltransferase T
VLAGLQLESDAPLSFAPVFSGATQVGRSMRSLYSPSARGAIALAQLSPQHAAPGTILTVRLMATGAHSVSARVVRLPFL